MSLHTLNVFDAAIRVGALEYESLEEHFAWRYDSQWPQAPDPYSISPHIPLSEEQPTSGTVRRFLENLLPEGRALDVVSITHQISKNNIYGLVRQLGRETSGALSFLPDNLTPQQQATTRREITHEELGQRIGDREHVPFGVWDGRVRLSIAGHQDKLAVYIDKERIYLVEGALASTHILKPDPGGRLPLLVANEHYCMSLANRLGLKAAPVSILRLPHPVLVVERFDRIRQDESVRRLHAIDACQALDLPVSYKYERNFGTGRDVRDIRDGASFERLFSAVSYTTHKAATRLALVRWALFNYLIGNADAHGKNVSFFCGPGGLTLTPFYDLVSVIQYPEISHELAMAYGDEFDLEQVRPFDWADFAHRTGTPRPLLAREMRRMAKATLAAAQAQEADAVYVEEEKTFVAKISSFIQTQGQKLIDAAGPMSKVDPQLL